jgi:hypothetical protein
MDENEGTHDEKDSEDALTLQRAWMKWMELKTPILSVEDDAASDTAPAIQA